MTFSILFWNVWLDNQIRGVRGSGEFLKELKRIVDQYQPDIMGLNEILQASDGDMPFVSDFLEKECGYAHNYFASASPFTDDWLIGTALYSRFKLDAVSDVAISKDTPAEKRGYKGFEVKAVTAKVALPRDHDVSVIVAHPMYLRKHTIKDHYGGTASLEKIIRSKEFSKDTILGGDFNEPGFMPNSFKSKVDDIMHFKTGSKIRHTWRHNAYSLTPIRANLDQLYWSKDSQFTLKGFKVLDSNISDHRPIFATFEY